MKINLNEIPPDGRTYTFNRETGELNDLLEDLIATKPFEVEFVIRPMGSHYELTGKLQTELPSVCAQCGETLDVKVSRKFHEILMEDMGEDRRGHSVHGNQSVDFLADGPSVTNYTGEKFNAGEYVHEAVALAEPFYPSCGDRACPNLAEVELKRQELLRSFGDAEETGHPAFDVLKALKIDPAKN